MRGWGQACSHEVAGKGYVFTKTSQMASIGAIFTSTYHTKQLNPWLNSSASREVNYSQLSACQRDVEPFEGDPSTCGCLTSLGNKPNQKQPGELKISTSLLAWIVSQCVHLSFDGKKCILILCVWKPAFLKSSHILLFEVFCKRWTFFVWNYGMYMQIYNQYDGIFLAAAV